MMLLFFKISGTCLNFKTMWSLMKTTVPFILCHNIFHVFLLHICHFKNSSAHKNKSTVSIHLKISYLRISGCLWCNIFRQKTFASFNNNNFCPLFFLSFALQSQIWTVRFLSCYSVLHISKFCISSPSMWKLKSPTRASV